MRLVQGAGMEDRLNATHATPHAGTITN
jgi:hypothetical protein